MISGAPKDVLEAAQKLACTSAVVVNLGVNRPDLLAYNWAYFYDREIFFTRISTPHLQSPNNVPEGCGSLQVECYYSQKYRPLDRSPEECIEPVIADLRRCGLLHDTDKIVFKEAKLIRYANVIFDLDRIPSLKIVHDFLDESHIRYCGRYGDWAYIWTDQAFVSGEKAAQKALDAASTKATGTGIS
jgi:protoporphyrinogen oxidase